MKDLLGSHDLLFVTLDTLRYDVAAELMAAGRTPNLARALPGGWERRHTPGSFTYAAHHAFFAGFLPTPVTAGRHERLIDAEVDGRHRVVLATPHPSAVLRTTDGPEREEAYATLVADLRTAVAAL